MKYNSFLKNKQKQVKSDISSYENKNA